MAAFFTDNFTVASDTELSAHTPSGPGTSWTKIRGIVASVKDLGSGCDVHVDAGNDDLEGAGSTPAGNNDGALYTADVAYPSANYKVY